MLKVGVLKTTVDVVEGTMPGIGVQERWGFTRTSPKLWRFLFGVLGGPSRNSVSIQVGNEPHPAE